MAFRSGRRAGLALLTAAAIMVLLGLAALAFSAMARGNLGLSSCRMWQVEGRLAVDAGIEYAVGRLYGSGDRFPGAPRLGDPAFDPANSRRPRPENRGDDWSYRAYDRDDGSHFSDLAGPIPLDWLDPPLSSTEHPSYAHGESWADADGDALFDVGESWIDADGNGRRDVWSGRLRGLSRGGIRFRLRVEPGAGGKIPIDILPPPPDPVTGIKPPDTLGDATRLLLNRLGAALGVFTTAYPTLGGSGAPVFWSDVGDRIMVGRPANGRGALTELASVLGMDGYRAIRRFVTLAPRLTQGGDLGLATCSQGTAAFVHFSPGADGILHLNAVPMRLLEAFLRYRGSSLTDRIARGLSAASPAVRDPHTKVAYTAFPSIVMIHPPEAWNTASGLACRVRATGGLQSSHEVYRAIDMEKQAWFPNKVLHQAGLFSYPSEGLQNAKIDIVFSSFFSRTPQMPPSLATYDVDRFVRNGPAEYPGSGRQQDMVPLLFGMVPFVAMPPVSGVGYTGNAPFNGTGAVADPAYGWSLGRPVVFDVRAESLSDGNAGVFAEEVSVRVGGQLLLQKQEDFQNLGGYPAPWGTGAGRRLTSRGIQVEGMPPLLSTSPSADPKLVNLDVVTTPCFPRETYDTGAGKEVQTPGSITLGHALHDFLPALPLTGVETQARFPCMTAASPGRPDTGLADTLWMDLPNGSQGPVYHPVPVPPELYGDPANLTNMRTMLDSATPFGVTMGPSNQYMFHQVNTANNPNGFPSLGVGSTPVSKSFLDPNGSVISTGDFRSITSCVFHFTYTGLPGIGMNPTEVFALKALQMSSDKLRPASTHWGLFRNTDGTWSLQFRNGTHYTPGFLGAQVPWQLSTWGSPAVAGHTQKFTGAYLPPQPYPEDPPQWAVPNPFQAAAWTAPHPVSWQAVRPYRITIYYFAQDDDDPAVTGLPEPCYPPTTVRCGAFIDGQHVIHHEWSRNPTAPRPYNPGYSPLASPEPSAEMFYRAGPAGPIEIPSVDLDRDDRRILAISFQTCTDIVFQAPGGTNPDASLEEAGVKAAHDAYRGAPHDFFRRSGTFSSARYVFPEPVRVSRANWGGIIPESVWEGIRPGPGRDKILAVTMRFYRADGILVGSTALKPRRVPALAAGSEAFCFPAGNELGWIRDEVAAFDFDVSFEIGKWGVAGTPHAGRPLIDVPAVEELLLEYRTPPRFLSGNEKLSGKDSDSTF